MIPVGNRRRWNRWPMGSLTTVITSRRWQCRKIIDRQWLRGGSGRCQLNGHIAPTIPCSCILRRRCRINGLLWNGCHWRIASRSYWSSCRRSGARWPCSCRCTRISRKEIPQPTEKSRRFWCAHDFVFNHCNGIIDVDCAWRSRLCRPYQFLTQFGICVRQLLKSLWRCQSELRGKRRNWKTRKEIPIYENVAHWRSRKIMSDAHNSLGWRLSVSQLIESELSGLTSPRTPFEWAWALSNHLKLMKCCVEINYLSHSAALRHQRFGAHSANSWKWFCARKMMHPNVTGPIGIKPVHNFISIDLFCFVIMH